jgi:hypothetical protein
MINLTINGLPVAVDEGTTILEAAQLSPCVACEIK